MRTFAYARPDDLAAAVRLVDGDDEATYIAGGTNLVDLMRLGVERPATLVDIADVVGGTVGGTPQGGLLIGAGVTNSDLAAHPTVRREYPAVARALLAGASGQIRNRATVGGNLLQRTRCVYFTDTSKPCNKRQPGAGCPARSGVHRDLGVLGTSDACIATNPSDLAVALAAVGARVHVTGPTGGRVLTLDELYRLPGADPSRDTTLERGEIVVSVELPPAGPLTRAGVYRKARDRASYAFALCSVAGAVVLEGDTVAEVALAFGALAPKPWRASEAERLLVGVPLTAETVQRAVDAELAAAEPLPGNAFKLELATRLAVATLAESAGVQLPVVDGGAPSDAGRADGPGPS